jgi:hypothetical protein
MYDIVVTGVISGGEVDEVVVATAVVPNAPAANSWLTGPLGQAVAGPFALRYFWHEPAMQPGERWYGGFDLGTQPASPDDLAFIPVNLRREGDDVTRAVTTPPTITMGSAVTTTIVIQPNVTPVDLTYVLTETIPAGLTVTDVTAPPGNLTQTATYLRWEGVMTRLGEATAVFTYHARIEPTACNRTLSSAFGYQTDNPGSDPAIWPWDIAVSCYQIHLPVVEASSE